MKRRNFILLAGSGGLMTSLNPVMAMNIAPASRSEFRKRHGKNELKADVIIAGAGVGGCAAALASLRNGLTVILTEETDWIGGQFSQQGVPPDEHRWIETHGATSSYRTFRQMLRNYYKRNYPLTNDAASREFLNPGDGAVSRLCIEPHVAQTVFREMLAPFISNGQLTLLTGTKVKGAELIGNKVESIEVTCLLQNISYWLVAPYFIDATETGELLPLTGTEYVTGTESQKETGELHAPEIGDPENQQTFTLCFAVDYVPGSNLIIDKPDSYDFWHSFVPDIKPPWPGRLIDLTYSTPGTLIPKTLGFHPEGLSTGNVMNLWNYRKIINRYNFKPGFYKGDISIINWPQNDYLLGNLVDVSDKEFSKHIEGAKQLNLSLLYWLQTEVPRPDGGTGWPGLRLRPDIMGTSDGMAEYPYIREGRRIRSLFTILEEHVGIENRTLVAGKEAAKKAASFYDSVGIGFYYLDLHPSTRGNNYIDLPSLPFELPLGALIPLRIENLIPACKNIGTTHITNGCYRLHPVEWNIGESVGMLAYYSLIKKVSPRAIREQQSLLKDFQLLIQSQGVEIKWPE